MPAPYLLQVHSHPIRVPISTWSQWYTEEHLRDMVYFKAAKTAALYKASSNVFRTTPADQSDNLDLSRTVSATPPEGNDFKNFLALYQTDREHCLEYSEYKDDVRVVSGLWDHGSTCHDVGSFSPTDLRCEAVVGEQGANEDSPARCIIHIKVLGPEAELDQGIIEAVLIEVAIAGRENDSQNRIVSGFQRSVSYFPIEKRVLPSEVNGNGVVKNGEAQVEREEPCRIVLYELTGPVEGKKLEEMVKALEAEGKLRASVRSYELVGFEGYGGRCKVPERLPKS